MMKRRKKKDLEIRFYENILRTNPNFIQVLMRLGDAYTRKGFYEEGLKVDRQLAKLRPDDPIVHYNLACSLSIVGEVSLAFKELRKAVALGYNDFSYFLKDSDLENVRKHPQFNSFLAEIKRLKNS
jgi:tetratricopeptide (TPR) repeat protein